MIETKTINNVKVIPAPVKKVSEKKIKGHEMIPCLYSNIFIVCKKNRGKSTLIYNMVKTCINKETQVIGFVSTHDKDNTYKELKKYLDKKKINNRWYSSIHEDNGLQELLNEMQQNEFDSDDSNSEDEYEPVVCSFPDEYRVKVKKKKSKYIAPKYLMIFDDLSTELKNPLIAMILKKNRHYRSKIIISSQYCHDIRPEGRTNLDIFLMGRGINEEKVNQVYKYSDSSLECEKFNELYEHATQKPYSFFFSYPSGDDYRKNFSEKYLIKDT